MKYQLAQLNLARMTVPLDDPVMVDFVNNLDRINRLAEESKGFVWRYIEERDADGSDVFDPNTLLVNMSVWSSLEDLFNFTYQTAHVEIFKRRKEWFTSMEGMHMVCWYIPEGEFPSLSEAAERLDHLNKHGQTPYAFTFKGRFSPDDYRNYLTDKPGDR